MIQIDGDACRVWPLADIAADGAPQCIRAEAPDGSAFEFPIEITAPAPRL